MVKYLNSEVKQQQLDWRRAQVIELVSMGYSQREIAHKLQVDLAAINRDIHFIRQEAVEKIKTHI
jgi:transposase